MPLPIRLYHVPARPYHIPCHVRESISYARQAIKYTMSCPPVHTIYHVYPGNTVCHVMPSHAIPNTMPCPPGHTINNAIPARLYHISYHAYYGKGPKYLVTMSHPVNYVPCHAHHYVPYIMSTQVIPYTMSCPPTPYQIPCHARQAIP